MTRHDWWDASCVIGGVLIFVALAYLVVTR
jgi:hypothetical protein